VIRMFIIDLEVKLLEEVQEYQESGRDLRELADILEVIDVLATQLGSSLRKY